MGKGIADIVKRRSSTIRENIGMGFSISIQRKVNSVEERDLNVGKGIPDIVKRRSSAMREKLGMGYSISM